MDKTKFTFMAEFEGAVIISQFETNVWTETFDKYLEFLRGAGYSIGTDPAPSMINTGVFSYERRDE